METRPTVSAESMQAQESSMQPSAGSIDGAGKKSGKPKVIAFIVLLSALAATGYFLVRQYYAQTGDKNRSQYSLPTEDITPPISATPTLSTSDRTTDIEKDLNSTQLEEGDSDFVEVNSDINAL